MKLKINKACDINSISVLPPQARKVNTGGPTSQLRSQQSQQSFSQSQHGQSQHGMYSQFSQSSLDEVLTNDQANFSRFGSQERENSDRRISCLAPISRPREESQMPISRSSTNMIRKWNSAPLSENKCQISEELEHKIGVVETSVNRTGLILDSVQGDVIQVNKGTKEISMEMDGLRQKLSVFDNSLQLMSKGQEGLKASLDEGFKAMAEELSKSTCEKKLQEILSMLSTLPGMIETCLMKLQNDVRNTIINEMQAMTFRLKTLPHNQIDSVPATILPPKPPTILPPKDTNTRVTLQQEPLFIKSIAAPRNPRKQPNVVPKIEMGSWNSIKVEHGAFADRPSNRGNIQKGVSFLKNERDSRVIIDSDEEIDGGFSCLLKGKETGMGNYMFHEAKEESERILRNARRRKRKYSNTIIIN